MAAVTEDLDSEDDDMIPGMPYCRYAHEAGGKRNCSVPANRQLKT